MVKSGGLHFFGLLFLGLICAGRASAEVHISALASDGKAAFFAGVKDQKRGEGLSSVLVEIRKSGKEVAQVKKHLPPAEIRDREIRALFVDANQVLVVTQWVIEQGDEPLVHRFQRKAGRWSRLGKLDCPQMLSLRAEETRLVFECEAGDAGVKSHELKLKVRFKGASGRIELPQASAQAGQIKGTLLGPVFEFDQLQLESQAGTEKIPAKNLK